MKKIKLFFTALTLLVTATAFAQSVSVKGVVTDASTGEPVPFAAIQLKGTMNGGSADANGNYSLSAPSDAVLIFSAIGYATVEEPVAGKAVHNIALSPDAQSLQETIIVAFGTSTKEAFTGSAKVVKSDELSKAQVTAITSALAGQVAGVQLTSSTGQPGSTPSIRIRGFSSINAGKEPLYVVDGTPYDGDINNINPSDVESMTVLKDAASNALYGARGANGVIMITTKRAKSNEAVVTFDAKYGINTRATRKYDYITNPAEYYEAHYMALDNYFQSQGYSPIEANAKANEVIVGPSNAGGLSYQVYDVPAGEIFIGTNGKLNPHAKLGNVVTYKGQDYTLLPDNWEDAAFRTGTRQEYNLSVAGGDMKSNVYGSIGYLDYKGITAKSDMKRFNARLKTDYQAKKWLKITGNMSYTNYKYNQLDEDGTANSTGNIWAYTSQIAPIYPLYVRDGNGNIMYDANGIIMMDYGDKMNAGLERPFMQNGNALQANRLNTNESEGNSFSAMGAAEINIWKGLKFTVNASAYVDEYRITSVENPYYGQFATAKGTVGKEHDRRFSYNTQQILNYSETRGAHNYNIMLGHEYYDYKSAVLYAAKQNMFSQDNKELAGAVVDNKSATSYTGEYNVEGYFARAEYDFDSRVYASASFRRDASSKFAVDHRWGSFWSLGAAWILSKEAWFNASWVNSLKLKASYGSQGNDDIGSYLYTDTFSIENSKDEVAVMFSGKGKRDITWETVGNLNVGTEFTLFDGIIDGGIDFFSRKTSDMLFAFKVAPSLGYTSYYDNVGDLVNNGVEFATTINIIRKKDFNWVFNFNATHVANKITYLHDDVKTLTVEGYDGYTNGTYFFGEGLPMYTRYLRQYAGPDPNTGVSTWWKDTKDADGNITGKERTTNYSQATEYLAPSSIPDLYGGFGTTVFFKGFDFSVNFSYQLGGKAYDSGYANYMSSPTQGAGVGQTFHKDIWKSWSADNKTDIPIFQYNETYSAGTSDRFLTDASYLNIENINVGYTIPAKITNKWGISSVRVYAACENVWYWSARQGFDPRYSFTGATNYTNYTQVRSFSGGLTFKF